ncbi:MAG: hypothetical protein D6E12_00555 [Desulfovibrio sp.]|nr:MAG: hypothetical protein D6E12_00555 [Desulfovibrio sp.]
MKSSLLTLIALALLASAGLAGCSAGVQYTGGNQDAEIAGAPYHEHAMQNLLLGRRYMAQGRYELARERFLIGLAAAQNPEMKRILAQEVQGCDMMVQSQR